MRNGQNDPYYREENSLGNRQNLDIRENQRNPSISCRSYGNVYPP